MTDDLNHADSEEVVNSESVDFPSTDEVDNHVQRDGWIWDDETGWNPPSN